MAGSVHQSAPLRRGRRSLYNGLIAGYPLVPGGKISANIIDHVSNQHGTATGGMAIGNVPPPNVFRAWLLDGVDDYLSVPAGVLSRVSGVNRFSIFVWVYFNSITSFRSVFDTANRQATFLVTGPTSWYFGVGGSHGSAASSISMTPGEWQRVGLVYDGTQPLMYRNGVLGSAPGLISGSSFSDEVRFGANPSGGGSSLPGGLADPLIWARALTAANVYEDWQLSRRQAYERFNTLPPVSVYNFIPADDTGTGSPGTAVAVAPTGQALAGSTGTGSPGTATATAPTGTAYEPINATGSGSPGTATATAPVGVASSGSTGEGFPGTAVATAPTGAAIGDFPTLPIQDYLGRLRRGDSLPITTTLLLRPTFAPTVRIYRAGTLVVAASLPLVDNARYDAGRYVFSRRVFLDATFTDGLYTFAVVVNANGNIQTNFGTFEVLGGTGTPPLTAVIEQTLTTGKAVVSINEAGTARIGKVLLDVD